MERFRITDEISVGGQPSPDDVRQLADEGFRALVNLREANEDDDPTSSREEGIAAREAGLTYLNYPVPKQGVAETHAESFRFQMKLLPRPVFVHCGSGQRAAALALTFLGQREQWTGQQALETARQAGIEFRNDELREFVTSYVDEHGAQGV